MVTTVLDVTREPKNIFLLWEGAYPSSAVLAQINVCLASIERHEPDASVYLFSNVLDVADVHDSANLVRWNYETLGAASPICGRMPAGDARWRMWSDVFRVLCLWKWGGTYFDVDDIMVRPFPSIRNVMAACFLSTGGFNDWRPFPAINSEYAVCPSTLSDSERRFRFGNDPLIRFDPENEFLGLWLESITNNPPQDWGQILPTTLFAKNPQSARELVIPYPWHDLLYHPYEGGHYPADKRYSGPRLAAGTVLSEDQFCECWTTLYSAYDFFLVKNHEFEQQTRCGDRQTILRWAVQKLWASFPRVMKFKSSSFDTTASYSDVERIALLSQILTKSGIKHWIDFGTLLGAVREGTIISGDCDFDIDFFQSDRGSLLALQAELLETARILILDGPSLIRGFPLHSDLDVTSEKTAMETCIQSGHLYIDFYPCDIYGKRLVHFFEKYSFRTFFTADLDYITIDGLRFPCPQHAQEMCTNRYGNNWQTRLSADEFRLHESELITPLKPHYSVLIPLPIIPFSFLSNRLLHHLSTLFDKVLVGVATDFDSSWCSRSNILAAQAQTGRADGVDCIAMPKDNLNLEFMLHNEVDYVLLPRSVQSRPESSLAQELHNRIHFMTFDDAFNDCR